MTIEVLVLKDSSGTLYTLTPDILKLARVKSETQKIRIRDALGNSSQSGFPLAGFTLAGVLPRAADPSIKREFVEPSLSSARGPTVPDP